MRSLPVKNGLIDFLYKPVHIFYYEAYICRSLHTDSIKFMSFKARIAPASKFVRY